MELREKFTIAEATAFLGFKSRSTINARTKAQGINRISFSNDEEGNKVISAVELQRVFPDKFKHALKKSSSTSNTVYEYSINAQKDTSKNADNTALIQALREQLEYERAERQRERQESQERESKADAREESSRAMIAHLTDTIAKQQLLLEHRVLKTESETNTSVEKPKGFWSRLFG